MAYPGFRGCYFSAGMPKTIDWSNLPFAWMLAGRCSWRLPFPFRQGRLGVNIPPTDYTPLINPVILPTPLPRNLRYVNTRPKLPWKWNSVMQWPSQQVIKPACRLCSPSTTKFSSVAINHELTLFPKFYTRNTCIDFHRMHPRRWSNIFHKRHTTDIWTGVLALAIRFPFNPGIVVQHQHQHHQPRNAGRRPRNYRFTIWKDHSWIYCEIS